MRLSLDAITYWTRIGYHTLQILEFDICIVNNKQHSGRILTNYPNEYFEFLNIDNYRLAFGKEKKCIYLSEVGWKYFKNDIQRGFNTNRGSWQDFLNYVNEHFKNVKEKTKLYRDKLKQKYQIVEDEINNKGW